MLNRVLCLLLLAAAFAVGVAARAEPVGTLPDDAAKCYLTVFGSPHDAKFATVVKWFNTSAECKAIKDATHFNVYTSSSKMYRERYKAVVPALPYILLERADGTRLAEYYGDHWPANPRELAADLKWDLAVYGAAAKCPCGDDCHCGGACACTQNVKVHVTSEGGFNPMMRPDDCPNGRCPLKKHPPTPKPDADPEPQPLSDAPADSGATAALVGLIVIGAAFLVTVGLAIHYKIRNS